MEGCSPASSGEASRSKLGRSAQPARHFPSYGASLKGHLQAGPVISPFIACTLLTASL